MGWIVEVISLPAITAFMTGSALNIAVGQVPSLLGISSKTVNSRDSTYLVIINVLKHLNACRLDAAMGLTALAMLYIIRSLCNWGARRMPQRKKMFFFLSTLRTAFVILFYVMISAAVNLHRRSKPAFTILGDVPRGFQHARVPLVDKTIISSFASLIPVTVIVMLIEHIAISKSFGRVNNYTIDPSQEMVAIGVTNLLGPFLGAYPATGSFSRTAIKSKAGVRTPFAGVITAVVVLLAIYALPPLFFYIPNASLSGVIIHAVGDLITPPNVLYQFWRVNPIEVIIWFAGMLVTIFTTIEIGIYVTVIVSMAVFLFRAFKAQGRFLGKVKIHSVVGDHVSDNNNRRQGDQSQLDTSNNPDEGVRNVFLPLSHDDGSNPEIRFEKPYPGIFIYRFSEGYNYPNANHYLDYMVKTIFQETRRTNAFSYPRPGVSAPSLNPSPFFNIPSQNILTTTIGPPLERPRPAPRQARSRPLAPADAKSHNPRLLLGQQRRHHICAAPNRRPQPAGPLHRATARRLALRAHQQPLDQARPRLRRLRLPVPTGRPRTRRSGRVETHFQRRRDRRSGLCCRGRGRCPREARYQGPRDWRRHGQGRERRPDPDARLQCCRGWAQQWR